MGGVAAIEHERLAQRVGNRRDVPEVSIITGTLAGQDGVDGVMKIVV